MNRIMCKSKIHRARVTEANLNYVGSLTIDTNLMKAADIAPFEQVHVVNVTNGARLVTYAIESDQPGTGTMCINGAAARLAMPDDIIIVITFAEYDERELEAFEPKIVFVDERNRMVSEATTERERQLS